MRIQLRSYARRIGDVGVPAVAVRLGDSLLVWYIDGPSKKIDVIGGFAEL